MAITKIKGIQIQDADVGTTQLADNAVTADKIAGDAVTTAKIAANAVTTAKITDANVTTAKIADDAVTTAKIAANAVTTAKITDANVTTAKIADANVTSAKIADDAVITQKIANNAVTATKLATTLDLSSGYTVSVTTPTADAHAATKGYVDSVAEGLDVKDSVKVATTGDITLSGTQTIDGVSVADGDRVLVKNQTDETENGVYVCDSGSWTRAVDFAAGDGAAGFFMFVEQGTTFGDTGFVCTSNSGSDVVGTNNLSFTQFSSAGVVQASTGISKDGNDLSLSIAFVIGGTPAASTDGTYGNTEKISSVTDIEGAAASFPSGTQAQTFLQVFLNGILISLNAADGTDDLDANAFDSADAYLDYTNGALYFPDGDIDSSDSVVIYYAQ
jgi:hypothetical protein